MWKIQLFKLNFDHQEADAVSKVIAGGWLTMGRHIEEFESRFDAFLGEAAHCTAVSSGTAALHMALLAVGVQPGDEVVIPALTFVADANMVRLVGARPVLADCGSLNDWNVTAHSIAACITPRTKAVIIVHYAGFPCEMQAISALCKARDIRLIEDVAHAPGASVAGQACGTWGDVGCFSFFSNKNISIGEGGMVCTMHADLHARMRYLRSHGMTTLTLDRHKGRAISYDVVEPGLNYRMDEMRAAIGLVQLEKLIPGNACRKERTNRYRRNLADSGVTVPFEGMADDMVSAFHILPVLLPTETDRIAVIESLKAKGIQSSIHYPPFWGFTAYKEEFSAAASPVAAEICRRELTLPLYPTMSDADVDMVTSALLGAL